MKKSTWARIALVASGALMAAGVGSAAMAADEPVDGDAVDINVEIPQIEEPGVLALSVDSDAVALTENGSDATKREFTGTLPTVTVTDTRTAAEVPADAAWVVLAKLTPFTGTAGQPPIAASSLGWSPSIVQGDAGDNIGAGVDVAPGDFAEEELLFSTFSSADAAPEDSFSANAGLTLRTPATVAPGSYTSTMTLSLFE